MSLDAFSVVVAFLALVEVALGVSLVAAATRSARAGSDESVAAANSRLALTAGTLLAVAVVSCPLLYLLLESWVPRWPGIMCVEGVRRIGTASAGASGWLPSLLATLDLTKPAVVLIAGAWLILRRADALHRRTATTVAVILGLVAMLDGAAQAAYVTIEKEAVPAVGGCCTILGPGETGSSATSFVATHARAWFPVGSIAMGAAALALRRLAGAGRSRTVLVALLATTALVAVPFGAAFLRDVAGPVALGLPLHRCAWCALAEAPETMAGTVLYGAAVLATAWASVARFASTGGDCTLESRLLAVASFGFLGTGAMSASYCWT